MSPIVNPYTNLLSLANFVGCFVGFLDVSVIRLVASSLPPRYPVKAKWYLFVISVLLFIQYFSA
jgi:hypothetical protein